MRKLGRTPTARRSATYKHVKPGPDTYGNEEAGPDTYIREDPGPDTYSQVGACPETYKYGELVRTLTARCKVKIGWDSHF